MKKVVAIKYSIVVYTLVLLALFFLFTTTAFAQAISLKIEPSVLQMRATPPADIQAPFSIENTGATPITLQINLKRFRDAGDGFGMLTYSENVFNKKLSDAFLKNVSIRNDNETITTLTLAPRQKEDLMLSVPILKESTQQDHYFSIVFVSEQEDKGLTDTSEESTSFSTIEAGVALPVILSVGQTNQKTAFLKTFSAPILQQKGPIPLTIEVQNTGEHFISAEGVILITNMFGQTVGRIDIPKTTILADSNRFFGSPGEKSQEIKQPKVFWDESFLLGFYTAKLALSIEPEQSLYTQSVSFVAFPFLGLLLLFVGLVGLGYFIFAIRKRISQQ